MDLDLFWASNKYYAMPRANRYWIAGAAYHLTHRCHDRSFLFRFFDDDSRPIQKTLTPRERTLYLHEIRKDITYFGRSYRKANICVDISLCSVAEAARKIGDELLKTRRITELKRPVTTCIRTRPIP